MSGRMTILFLECWDNLECWNNG